MVAALPSSCSRSNTQSHVERKNKTKSPKSMKPKRKEEKNGSAAIERVAISRQSSTSILSRAHVTVKTSN